MANSVEARLPYTDFRLIEHAMRMPDALKFAGGVNKIALRRVAAGRIPESVSARKQKFGFPVSTTLRAGAELHEMCLDLLASDGFRERGIYDVAQVRRLLDNFDVDQPSQVDAVFEIVQVELWLRGLDAAGQEHRWQSR